MGEKYVKRMNFWENLTPLDSSHLEVFLGFFWEFSFFEFKFEFWIWAGLILARTETGPDRFDRKPDRFPPVWLTLPGLSPPLLKQTPSFPQHRSCTSNRPYTVRATPGRTFPREPSCWLPPVRWDDHTKEQLFGAHVYAAPCSSSCTASPRLGSLLMLSIHLALIRTLSRLCFSALRNDGLMRQAKNSDTSAAFSSDVNWPCTADVNKTGNVTNWMIQWEE